MQRSRLVFMFEQEAANNFQEVREQFKPSPYYASLTSRRFRNPAKYTPWEYVAADLTAEIMMAQMTPWEEFDPTKRQCVTSAMLMEKLQGPVYWCDRNLLDSLMQTETPAIGGLNKLFYIAAFLFPDDWLRDPDGWPIRYVVVSQYLKGESPPTMEVGTLCNSRRQLICPPAAEQTVSFHTTVATGASYWKGLSILDDGSLGEEENPVYREATPLSALEADFTNKLAALVFQLMLVMQSMPEAITEAVSKSTNKKKNRKKQQIQTPMLNPRWIGREFKVKRESSPIAATGSHASPRTHWRTGHWRRVPVGEGRQQRKWAWIRPTLVNGN